MDTVEITDRIYMELSKYVDINNYICVNPT